MNKKNELHKYFLSNGKNVIHKWLHYFDIYEQYFNKYINQPILMIEIGVFKGGSLNMWKDYFGNKATIVGIDINPTCKKYERKENNIHVEIGDQSDTNFLQSVIDKYGNPNILLDDGSHLMNDLIKTFEFLYPKLKENSTYMVEDTHTSYWNDYDGGLKKKGSFIEYAKEKIDEINAFHTKGELPINYFTKTTQSMHVFDSIIVFEKKPQGTRNHLMTGGIDNE